MARPTSTARTPPPNRDEIREVRVSDPHLSPSANERLTEDLRETLGADEVRVPADRPRASRGELPQRSPLAERLGEHRFLLVRTFCFALVVGAILALLTGSWWLLPAAVIVHAAGTVAVATIAIGMTTSRERPAPTTVAQLSEEGVRDPERHFSALVEEFSPASAPGTADRDARGTADVLTPGHNVRRAEAIDAPAQASAEQSGAMTPTSGPSAPAEGGGTPDAILWLTIAGLAVLSIVIPAAFGGGALWLLTAIMIPLLAGWVALQGYAARRDDART
jgi:hypothetical protein